MPSVIVYFCKVYECKCKWMYWQGVTTVKAWTPVREPRYGLTSFHVVPLRCGGYSSEWLPGSGTHFMTSRCAPAGQHHAPDPLSNHASVSRIRWIHGRARRVSIPHA